MMSCLFVFGLALLLLISSSANIEENEKRFGDLSDPDNQHIQLYEDERIVEYHRRNYTWPIQNYIPDTPGWRRLMQDRFAQMAQIPNLGERYEGYIQTIHSAFLVPNFTEHGFGLVKCPDDLLKDLQEAVRNGISTADLEAPDVSIPGPRPWFISAPELVDRVLHELHSYAETWSGLELTPYRAYGFRLYQPNNQLYMHLDKMQTHIISFILHIDASVNSQPSWPLVIEDFYGQTHEIVLTPGDMLLYESSKCLHGRPRPFTGGGGSWYTSVFAHYYPKHGWYDQNHALEAHYAVPPHWNQDPDEDDEAIVQRLEMVDTSMIEPGCDHQWCRLQDSIQWGGPAEHGVWMAPNGERYPFHPPTTNDDAADNEL